MKSEAELRKAAKDIEKERDAIRNHLLPELQKTWTTSTDMQESIAAKTEFEHRMAEVVWKNAVLGTLGFVLEDKSIGLLKEDEHGT